MINFLDVLDLYLQMTNLADDIPDKLIQNIIDDNQFQPYNYDYGILFILSKRNMTLINENTVDIDEWQQWLHNTFFPQLVRLSKYKYSNDEITILEKYFYYKTIFFNIQHMKRQEESIQDILDTLSISVDENCSAWLAREELRLLFLTNYTSSNYFKNNLETVKTQLALARQNFDQKEKLRRQFELINYTP